MLCAGGGKSRWTWRGIKIVVSGWSVGRGGRERGTCKRGGNDITWSNGGRSVTSLFSGGREEGERQVRRGTQSRVFHTRDGLIAMHLGSGRH